MSRSAALLFFAIALVVICLPALVVSLGRPLARPSPGHSEVEKAEPDPVPGNQSLTIKVYHVERQQVVVMNIEEYLVGVVMAEMPATFGLEALKAQAVVARTYTLQRSLLSGNSGCSKAPVPADVCTDSTHCQAWVDPLKGAAEMWPPEQQAGYLEKIEAAVRDTAGEVVVYHEQLIEAVYHSTCGGQTEASQAIWSGGPLPYLQSISCPYCESSPYYRREMQVTFEQLAAALNTEIALPVAEGAPLPLQVDSVTPGGRVGILKVNDKLIEGKEVRRLLNLPSTAFTWEQAAGSINFITRGYGHGVGVCQYGADGMAAEGKSYRQIISFYYPGTDITTYSQ
jgi:stage II sporulation protein D